MELLVSVSVSPEFLPFPCPSSHRGLSSPHEALPCPTAPPSGALCLCPQRHLSLQDPFLIPGPPLATGALTTATLHLGLGLEEMVSEMAL